jgi:hypothetical protein
MRFLQRRGLPANSSAQQTARFVRTLSNMVQSQLVKRDGNALALIRSENGDIDREQTQAAISASGRPGARPSADVTLPATDAAEAIRTQPTDAAANSQAAIDTARQAERERIRAIRELATPDLPEGLVNRACDEGWSPDEAGRRFYEHVRRHSAAATPNFDARRDGRSPGIHTRRGATIEALQGALLLRAGLPLDSQHFRNDRGQAMLGNAAPWAIRAARALDANATIPGEVAAVMEDAHRYRNRSLVDICRLMLKAKGRSVPSDSEAVVERSFSSSDLRVTFGPVVIAQILAGYEEYPDSTIGWVQEADWNDFRENNVVQIDPASQLKRHVRNKEAPAVELVESAEKYKVERFVGMFQLDSVDIINDMLGVLPTLPAQLGQMARELRPDLVAAILMSNPNLGDGSALFATGSPRTNALTSSALAQATVQSLEAVMAKQTITGSDGVTKPLNLKAGHIFVPRSLRLLAKRLVGSEFLTDAAGNLNALRGEFTYSADSRLDMGVTNPLTGTFVAGSATTWYMAAAGGAYGLQIGYRRGTGRAPQVMTKALNIPGRWGIGWDVAMDIGIGVTNFRGLARAAA